MSLPPFTMSKYISELDLHKDAHAYYKAENATLRARIEELEEDIEAYRESQRQRAHGSEEAFIRKLNARIAELEAAVETAACRFEDPKFHCCWQDAADDLRRVVVR